MKKDKRGVFGLTSVQQFFIIILGIALLAYVMILILGTLGGTTILPQLEKSYTNESVTPTDAGVALACNTNNGCTASITQVLNASTVLQSGNYTVSGCTLYNTTSDFPDRAWNVTYSCRYNSRSQNDLSGILQNTSIGVTSFFTSINPVYAILAVLVIILVLVVLVRVVQAPAGQSAGPQL